MKAWRKYRGREIWPEHWRLAVALRRFVDRGTLFLLAKGKRVRFERKRDIQLKRAMQLVQVEDMVATMSARSEMQAGTNCQSLSQGL